ncbi:NAD-dependent epimerase/dehydratase family protein [Novosphingobium album (ex Liu et al. 2023)]|uniref:NAD(P)-dependent oxidoreductase n=1 Tax=Novosphingobium album (ex Liu et al. 2023) TaxID=3031130 RepID=A0ABT5WM94_9SPHN|nr:NAD(P)-dependent oxidoreductase [Novosphingobium album (ex Liu et al. 2023)]MDE8650412.1 NAD(P)-dependent oxidoreductase [Novosphingobium album (ex Liu et al. 2023)]
MTIALTGGTGFVGKALIDRVLASGRRLSALARQPQEPREGVAWVPGDLADPQALAALVRGCAVVIHVAGVVNAPDPHGFEQGNVTGTMNLIEAVLAEGVRRFIFVSSLSAREPGLSAYGASKARAEKLVTASGLDWTIVRPPAIYGPHDREMLDLFRAAKWGFVPVPAQGRASVIHVEDLADLLVALASAGTAPVGARFEPDDGRIGGWSHHELARAIGAAVGRQPRVIGLSRAALERAARLDRMLRGPRAKMTADRAAYFSHPDWIVSRGAAVPGRIWTPRIETHAGLKATAQWYRQAGWL